MEKKKLKELLMWSVQEADTDDNQGTLGFEEFCSFYKMMSTRRDLYLLMLTYSNLKDHLDADDLTRFLENEQKVFSISSVVSRKCSFPSLQWKSKVQSKLGKDHQRLLSFQLFLQWSCVWNCGFLSTKVLTKLYWWLVNSFKHGSEKWSHILNFWQSSLLTSSRISSYQEGFSSGLLLIIDVQWSDRTSASN